VFTDYKGRLLADQNLRLKKPGEEAVELALASAAEDREAVVQEEVDPMYRARVACAAAGA
jgi:phosphoribosyl-ATP pyrophosphohydrolase/phosphoribosyl-AMP cyclohydrolase